MATQTLLQRKSKNMRITVDGELAEGVGSKDVILYIIGVIGTAGGTGSVIEYAGSVFRGFSMEARMSVWSVMFCKFLYHDVVSHGDIQQHEHRGWCTGWHDRT